MPVETSSALVIRDGICEDLAWKDFRFLLGAVLVGRLLNWELSLDCNAAAMHVLRIRTIKAFLATLNLKHEKRKNIWSVKLAMFSLPDE